MFMTTVIDGLSRGTHSLCQRFGHLSLEPRGVRFRPCFHGFESSDEDFARFLRIGLSILTRSPSFQFPSDLVMDNPSGLQNELKDSTLVIVSDIVIPCTKS